MACLQPQWLDGEASNPFNSTLSRFSTGYPLPLSNVMSWTTCVQISPGRHLSCIVALTDFLGSHPHHLSGKPLTSSEHRKTTPCPVAAIPAMPQAPTSLTVCFLAHFFSSLHLPDHLKHCLVYPKCYIYYTGTSQVRT